MIYFEVREDNGKILASNMQEFLDRDFFEDNKNFSQITNGRNLKGFFQELGDGINVWVVVENEDDIIKSTKIFRKTLSFYKLIALGVYDQHKKEIDSYNHMLNTVQAQMKQKMEDFADNKDFYGDSYEDSLEKVLKIIDENKQSAADLICYMHKRVVDMRAQLLGSEVIHSGGKYEAKLSKVRLKRAILNQCTPFIQDLDERSVKIKFFFEDGCEVEVDKNMFSLIMYNFFSNAAKYVKSNSEIRFNYSSDAKRLDISMISLKMEKSEIGNLFLEGKRGKYSKSIPGKGIGLFVIQEALKIMNKEPMYIKPAYEKNFNEDGLSYIENHFQFLI